MKKKLSALFFTLFLFSMTNISHAQMSWNQACSFAGNSTSYIRVQNSSLINLTGSFTLEAWVNPSTLSGLSKGIFAKGSSLGSSLKYGLRVQSSGRVDLVTNGSLRLVSTPAHPVKINEWTHVSATYNNSTNKFSIYINGILDTNTILAAAPPSNSDSLFIGISGGTTPFKGLLDEVRIWNRELSATEVLKYMRTSLETASGIYAGLVFSMPFQNISNVSPFTTNDFIDKNNVFPMNVSASDQSFQPYHTIIPNESIQCFSNGDYLAAKDNLQSFPSGDFSFECWYYLKVSDNIFKTVFLKTAGGVTAFSLSVNANSIRAIINNQGSVFNSASAINTWIHVTVVFDSQTGNVSIFKNADSPAVFATTETGATTSTDSMYIGGGNSTQSFVGLIDEVRITGRELTPDEVKTRMYRSFEKSDDTEPSVTNLCYNLDGNAFDNGENSGPQFYFRKNASYSHVGQSNLQPRSPILNTASDDFYKAFYFVSLSDRIPATGTQGVITNFQQINLDNQINDVDLCVMLDHTNLKDIKISLVGANGDSIVVFDGDSAKSADNNLALVFNDDADSSLKNNTYSSFCSEIKPLNSMDAFFAGTNTKGTWRIRIQDKASSNTGILYTWGIRFNNMPLPENNFDMSFKIQGFYDPVTQLMPTDTVEVILRNFTSPYNIVSTSKAVFNPAGNANLSFSGVTEFTKYYLQIAHRNSLETWSGNSVSFSRGIPALYNFYTSDTTAFGNNEVQVSASPLRYAIYSGDVNQDGNIDLSDLTSVYNDAGSFVSGYIVTDVTGDGNVDLNDVTLVYNNSNSFVARVIP